MSWRIFHLIAACIGLAATLSYAILWLWVWRHGGEAFFVFKWWFEWHIEPYLLIAFVVVVLTSAIKQLLDFRR